MRGHSQQWPTRAKPKIAIANSIKIFLVVAIMLSEVVRGAAPVARVDKIDWDMGRDMVLYKAFGLDTTLFFNNTNINTTFSLTPANPSWCRMTTFLEDGNQVLTIARALNTDANGPLSHTMAIVATNSDGSASIPVTATITAPGRTARYPISSSLPSLAAQSARQVAVWFADLFPPQSFALHSGQYAGVDNVLAVNVNANGQPSARVAAFNDSSLSNEQYNKQGRRYNLNQKLPMNVPLSVSTSIYIPGQWIDNAPGASGCTAAAAAACSRVALIEIELGEATGGVDGTFRPSFYARMGFDNRKQTDPGFNFATAFLGGPITEDPGTYPNWPYSSDGLYIDFPLGRTSGGWENELQKDAWNHFTFEIFLRDTDPSKPAPTYKNRGCKEVISIRWLLNGKRFLIDSNDPQLSRSICTVDPAGQKLVSKTDTVRDIIVTTYNAPGDTTGYTSYFGNMNLYSTTTPDVVMSAPVPQPPPLPPPQSPPLVLPKSPPEAGEVLFPIPPSNGSSDYEYTFFDDYAPPPSPTFPAPPSPAVVQTSPSALSPSVVPSASPSSSPSPSPSPVPAAPSSPVGVVSSPPLPPPPKASPPPLRPPPKGSPPPVPTPSSPPILPPPKVSPPPPKQSPPPPVSASDYAADYATSEADSPADIVDYDYPYSPPEPSYSPPKFSPPPPKGWRKPPPPPPSPPPPKKKPPPPPLKKPPPPPPLKKSPPPPAAPAPDDYEYVADYGGDYGDASGAGGGTSDAVYVGDYDYSEVTASPPPKRQKSPPRPPPKGWRKTPPPASPSPSPSSSPATSAAKNSPPPPPARRPPPPRKKPPPPKAQPKASPPPLAKRKPPPPKSIAGATKKSPPPPPTKRPPPPKAKITAKSPPPKRVPSPVKKSPPPPVKSPVKRPPPPQKKIPPSVSTVRQSPPPPPRKKSPAPATMTTLKRPPPPLFKRTSPPPPKKKVVAKTSPPKKATTPSNIPQKKRPPPPLLKKKPPPPRKMALKRPPPPGRPRSEGLAAFPIFVNGTQVYFNSTELYSNETTIATVSPLEPGNIVV